MPKNTLWHMDLDHLLRGNLDSSHIRQWLEDPFGTLSPREGCPDRELHTLVRDQDIRSGRQPLPVYRRAPFDPEAEATPVATDAATLPISRHDAP